MYWTGQVMIQANWSFCLYLDVWSQSTWAKTNVHSLIWCVTRILTLLLVTWKITKSIFLVLRDNSLSTYWKKMKYTAHFQCPCTIQHYGLATITGLLKFSITKQINCILPISANRLFLFGALRLTRHWICYALLMQIVKIVFIFLF